MDKVITSPPDVFIEDASWPTAVYCKKCGKEFYPTPEHIYRDHKGRYCCWTCFNHRNDGKASRFRAVVCVYPNGEILRTFQSATKAAEWTGTEVGRLKQAIEEGTKWHGYFWRYKDQK